MLEGAAEDAAPFPFIPASGPRSNNAGNPQPESVPVSITEFFFSTQGRISRKSWWLGLVVVMALSVAVSGLLDPAYVASATTGAAPAQPTLPITLWNLALCWPSAAMTIKRLNDRGWPEWIGYGIGFLFVLLVIANHFGFFLDPDQMQPLEKLAFAAMLLVFLWALIDNGLLEGDDGPNRHGPDPLKPAGPDTLHNERRPP